MRNAIPRSSRLPVLAAHALVVSLVLLAAGCGGGDGGPLEGRTTTTMIGPGTAPAEGEQTEEEPDGGWEALLASEDECPGQNAADGSDEDLRSAVICLIDHARSQRGLRQLERSEPLQQSASRKARDIVRCEEFSHTACDRDQGYWFQRVGYMSGCRRVGTGENLGIGERQLGSPRRIVLGWLESSGHRRNMLSDRWTEQAIARTRVGSWQGAVGDQQRTFRQVSIWVSHFGYRSGC